MLLLELTDFNKRKGEKGRKKIEKLTRLSFTYGQSRYENLFFSSLPSWMRGAVDGNQEAFPDGLAAAAGQELSWHAVSKEALFYTSLQHNHV